MPDRSTLILSANKYLYETRISIYPYDLKFTIGMLYFIYLISILILRDITYVNMP